MLPRPGSSPLPAASREWQAGRSRCGDTRSASQPPLIGCNGDLALNRQVEPSCDRRSLEDRSPQPEGPLRLPKTGAHRLVTICVRDPGSLPIGGVGRPAMASSGRAAPRNFLRHFCNGLATGGWVIGRGHESGHHAGSGPGSGSAGRGPRAGGDPGGGGRGPGRDHPGVPDVARPRGNRRTRRGRLER